MRAFILRRAPELEAAALTLLILGPLLAPGFVLTFDMVFVPRQPLTPDLVGLGTMLPRAVPSDAVAAIASRVLPADVVQKTILAAALFGAGVGASRLLPARGPAVRSATAAMYVWNAYVAERLLMGHWPMLVAYGALPWAVAAARRYRTGEPGALSTLTLWTAVASVASYAGVYVPLTAAAVASWPSGKRRGAQEGGWRRAAVVAVTAIAVNAAWIVPSLFRAVASANTPRALAAFAPKADTALGTFGSLATLGGIWNRLAVPIGRGSLGAVPLALAVLAVAMYGAARLPRRWAAGGAGGLMAAAAAGFVVALATAIPWLRGPYASIVARIPIAGGLRDSQKLIAPLALVEALGFGLGAEGMLGRVREGGARRTAAILFAAAPLASLPGLAWAEAGALGISHYPGDWATVREIVDRDPAPGAILVLPWHGYVAFSWNEERIQLDPATRFFRRRALIDDDLELLSGRVPGDDPWSRLADPIVRSGRPLAPDLPSVGARYVLLQRIGRWRSLLPRLRGLAVVERGPTLTLYRGRQAQPPGFRTAPVLPVVAADAAAAATVASAIVAWFVASRSTLLISFRGSRGRLR